jgi:hypothetical protein
MVAVNGVRMVETAGLGTYPDQDGRRKQERSACSHRRHHQTTLRALQSDVRECDGAVAIRTLTRGCAAQCGQPRKIKSG